MNKAVLILLLLLSPTIFAKNTQRTITSISGLFVDKVDFSKRENRKLLASALRKNLSELNKIIPRNTPEDSTWLRQEMEESKGDTQREINYLSTSIYSKFWLKDRLEWMIKYLDEILVDSLSLKYETIIWISIGDFLHSEYEMIDNNFQQLIKNKIITIKNVSKATGMPLSVRQSFMYKIWGNDIVQQVVIQSIAII